MSDVIASDQLRLLIERVERLEAEKKAIADDIKSVYGEAKATGFDVKTMRAIVSLRKMDATTRREAEAMLDTYKAALGMLDGTPLGRWAVERLKPKQPEPKDDEPGDTDNPPVEDAPEVPPEPAAPELTVADAHRMGAEDAANGVPITKNPFPAFDERRAAYDEAWCQALGSDGMDIPDALKPKPKPKKAAEPDKGGEA